MSILELEYVQLSYKQKAKPVDILDQVFKRLKFFKRFEKDV